MTKKHVLGAISRHVGTWSCRTEKNGIGDYGSDEHYRSADGKLCFTLRITYCPPKTVVLNFKETQ